MEIRSHFLSIGLMAASLSIFTGCGQFVQNKNQPRAIGGVLDLADWDFAKDGPVNLSGEYEFYWQQHLTPESFSLTQPPERSGFIRVPAYWKGYVLNGTKLPGASYATYRLTVLLKDSSYRKLAVKFLDMGTAYTVFANGEKILSVGTAGQTPETTVPRYFPQVVDFALDANRLEFIYQVSNFHHHRGGAWESVRLGTTEQISAMRERRLALDLFLFGSIVAMGLYHLALFGLRKSDLSSCFFGVFCLLIAVRLLTTVERFLLHIFPSMGWELFIKIEYLSVYLAVPVFAVFLHRLFSQDFHKPVVAATSAIGLLFSSLVVLTPARIFTQTLHAYQLFIIMSMVYVFSMLVLCAVRQREGAAIMLFGFLFLAAAIVNDILDAAIIIQSGHFVHLGLFIFIFSHAFMLSSRYARAFTTIEMQRLYLTKANVSLQAEIAEHERTKEELHRNEERFRQLAENIEEVFWLVNLEKDQMIYISSGYEKIWGHRCESLYAAPQNWLKAIHPEDRELVHEAALTKQVSGQYDEIYRIQRPDGSIRWIRDRAFPIRDQTGAIYRIAGIAEDITAFKQVEEALRQSEERYRGLIESSPEAIFVEQEGKLVYINPAGLRLLGYDAVSEHNEHGLKDLFDKNAACPLEKFSRMKRDGLPAPVIEVKFIRKDGKLLDGEVTFIITMYQGKPAIQALARDITETKYLRQKAERYDPFFTTRTKGIGLGLAVVLRILEQHHAPIFVESQVGAGTKFTITFRLA